MLDMLMNEPIRRATIDGDAYFIARNGALTCTARSSSKAFGSVSAIGPVDDTDPALLTTQSIRPKRRSVVSTSARTSRSEEHTSELQSLAYLVCRLLLEK